MTANDQQLPEGWVLSDIGNVTLLSKDKVNPPFSESTKYLSLEHIESNTSRILGWEKASVVRSTKAVFHTGDILYGKLRPYLNKVCITSFDGICSTDVLVFKNTPFIDNTFVHNYLKSSEVVNYANQNMSGVQLPRISYEKLSEYPIPLAPLPEQKRIAAKLDNLLPRVSNVGQRLGRATTILKRFRQSVLAAACSGKLTEDWREKHPDLSKPTFVSKINSKIINDVASGYEKFDIPDVWEWFIIDDIASVKGGKRLPAGSDFSAQKTEYPYIMAGSLKNGTILPDRVSYIDQKTQQKISRYIVSYGDVYITIVGACIGDAGIIPKQYHGANLTENALKITDFTNVFNTYVATWLRSPQAKDFIKKTVMSCAQGKLALGRVKAFPIPLPPLEEQKEIVLRVEKLFSFADKIEARVKAVQAKTDKLPQSILNKAFRGQLVPTEAQLARLEGRNYETAEELLARIQKGKRRLETCKAQKRE